MAVLDEPEVYLKDDKLLYTAIRNAFDQLYKKDKYLICNYIEQEHHVGERPIVFRFGHYLINEIECLDEYAQYNIDCEYNRNILDIKMLPSFPNGTYPDLVIHRRGRNDHNLLVMEFKSYWNPDINTDIEKVTEFMSGPYNYKYGLVMLIGRNIDDLRLTLINGDK